LAKHRAKKYGPSDEGFFTRCMAAEELASYPEENRKVFPTHVGVNQQTMPINNDALRLMG
jgi:hypothetical protein